jgi:hypothetical protein
MKGAAGWASNVASYVRCRGHENRALNGMQRYEENHVTCLSDRLPS